MIPSPWWVPNFSDLSSSVCRSRPLCMMAQLLEAQLFGICPNDRPMFTVPSSTWQCSFLASSGVAVFGPFELT